MREKYFPLGEVSDLGKNGKSFLFYSDVGSPTGSAQICYLFEKPLVSNILLTIAKIGMESAILTKG